jgi:bifunctional non-homologous end joining protein LigD
MPTQTSASLAKIIADLDAIEAAGEEAILHLGKTTYLRVSHLDKVFFPVADVTKGDLMRYYVWASRYLLPIMRDRPLALKRFPDGIDGKSFFQQKAPSETPESVRVQTLSSASGEQQHRLIGGSLATLLYCVQLGVVEVNPWNVRMQSLYYPDYTVIDLDPGSRTPFTRIIETALWIKEMLDRYDLHAAVKTSGSRGIHIFIPLASNTRESDAERISKDIALVVAKAHPTETTVHRTVKARGETKVYVDYGQNALGKTVAAAYSVRAKPDATVSTPVSWEELTPDFDPNAFTIHTLPDRIETIGDLWALTMQKPNIRRAVTKM